VVLSPKLANLASTPSCWARWPGNVCSASSRRSRSVVKSPWQPARVTAVLRGNWCCDSKSSLPHRTGGSGEPILRRRRGRRRQFTGMAPAAGCGGAAGRCLMYWPDVLLIVRPRGAGHDLVVPLNLGQFRDRPCPDAAWSVPAGPCPGQVCGFMQVPPPGWRASGWPRWPAPSIARCPRRPRGATGRDPLPRPRHHACPSSRIDNILSIGEMQVSSGPCWRVWRGLRRRRGAGDRRGWRAPAARPPWRPAARRRRGGYRRGW
jgi:hypothetical protein